MREIEIVGPADDRRFLLARDTESAETFHVVADPRLRSLYHADAPPAVSQERPMNPLTPREIQSRIRHGASPEELAASAEMPVDKIMGFALPVLAEREHIAERARVAPVRRRYADGSITLQDALRAELTAGRVDDADWNAWRRDDGRWTVTVAFEHAEPGTFIFDPHGRYVIADSVHASTLIGDTDATSPDMALAQALVEAGASADVIERIAEVEVDEPTEPAPEEHDAALDEAVTPAGPAADRETDDAPAEYQPKRRREDAVPLSDLFDDEPPAGVASLKRARDRRAMGQLALADLDDYGAEAPPAEVPSEPEAPAEPPSTVAEEIEEPAEPAPEAATEPETATSERPQVIEAPEPSADEEPARPKKRERRRVPSWDEIMFGNSSP